MSTPSVFRTPAGEKAVMALYDDMLARWPVPHETLNIATCYGDTFVIASGDTAAMPLVLIHGAGSNSLTWGADVADYSRTYCVYAVDLLGEAGKSAQNRPAWDSPAYAEWLDQVFDALGIDRAVLIGLSQGGWTALRFAVYKPERVQKLVLMTPGGVIPTRASFLPRALSLMLLGSWGRRRLIESLFGDQPLPEGLEEPLSLIMHHFKARIGVLPIFSDEELRRLTMPTLLLGGTRDIVNDMPRVVARMQVLLPCLTVTIIPGAGHALLNTTGRILSFLTA